MRYYEPDFVPLLENGDYYLIETKGLEDVDAKHKDRAAKIWCEYASSLTDMTRNYLKVQQQSFLKLEPNEFSDLIILDDGMQQLLARA